MIEEPIGLVCCYYIIIIKSVLVATVDDAENEFIDTRFTKLGIVFPNGKVEAGIVGVIAAEVLL